MIALWVGLTLASGSIAVLVLFVLVGFARFALTAETWSGEQFLRVATGAIVTLVIGIIAVVAVMLLEREER